MDDHLLSQRLSVIDGKIRNEKQGKNIFVEVIMLKGEPREVRRLYVEHENGFRGVGWIIDDDISECMVCSREFNFFLRKHHCRSCGNLVCYNCSPHEVTIYELSDLGPQRVCIQCFWGQDPVYVSHTRSWDDDEDEDFDEDDAVLQSRIHAELNAMEKTFHFVIANQNTVYAFNGPIILIQNAPWKQIELAVTRQFNLPVEISIKAMQLMSKEGDEESPLLDTSQLFWQYSTNYSPLLSNYFLVYLSKQQTRLLKEAMIARMHAEDAMYAYRPSVTEQDENNSPRDTEVGLRLSDEPSRRTPVKQDPPQRTAATADAFKDLELEPSLTSSIDSPMLSSSPQNDSSPIVEINESSETRVNDLVEASANVVTDIAIEDSVLDGVMAGLSAELEESALSSVDAAFNIAADSILTAAVTDATDMFVNDKAHEFANAAFETMTDSVLSDLSVQSVNEYVCETIKVMVNSSLEKIVDDEVSTSVIIGIDMLVSEHSTAACGEALVFCADSTVDECVALVVNEAASRSAHELEEKLIADSAELAINVLITGFIEATADHATDCAIEDKTDASVAKSAESVEQESIDAAVDDAITSILEENSESAVEEFSQTTIDDEINQKFEVALSAYVNDIVDGSVEDSATVCIDHSVNECVIAMVNEVTDNIATNSSDDALDAVVEALVLECLASAQAEYESALSETVAGKAVDHQSQSELDKSAADVVAPSAGQAVETSVSTAPRRRRSSWLQLSDEDRMLLSLATRRSTASIHDAETDTSKNNNSDTEVRRPSITDVSRFRDGQRLMSDETLLKLAQQPFYHFPLPDAIDNEEMVIKNNDPFSENEKKTDRLSDAADRESNAASTILTLREIHYQALQTAFKNISQDSGVVTLAQLLAWEDINHVVEEGVLSIVDINRVYTRVHARKDLNNTADGLTLEGFCEFMERLEALAEEGLVQEEAKAAIPEPKNVKRASYVSSMSLDSIGEMLGLGSANIMAQVTDAFHSLIELQDDASLEEITFDTLCKWDALRYAIKENVISQEHVKSIFHEILNGKSKDTLNLEEFSVLSFQIQQLIDASEVESAVERIPESRESVVGDMEIVIQGELFKQGQKVKSWKKRLCVVRGCRLSYFDGTKLKGEFSFRGGSVEKGDDRVVGRPFSMLLRGSGASTDRVLVLCAGSEVERLKWMEALQLQIDRYDMRVTEPVVRETSVSLPTESVSGGSKEWARYLDETEHVVMNGEITKRNKYGLAQKRQLLLTTAPRLIYIDEAAKAIKGEIQLKQIQIELINATTFKVTSEGRAYRLVCSQPQAEEWTRALKSIA